MMKSAVLTFVLLFSIPANGDVSFTLDELIKLKEEAEQHVSEPPDFMAAFDQYYQEAEGGDGRLLQEGAEGSCGYFHDKCGPELTCMRFGIEHKCVPVECLVNLGQQYRNTTFTNLFYEQIFEKAGVTPEEVGLAFAEKDEYRDDPSALFGFDNPWKRFATVFHNNAPDFTEMLAKTNECMAKAPSVQGVTPMIGFTYGVGALVKLDWAFFWGIGSGDINIEDGTSFIPSTVYEISLAGLLGAHIHVSGMLYNILFKLFYHPLLPDLYKISQPPSAGLLQVPSKISPEIRWCLLCNFRPSWVRILRSSKLVTFQVCYKRRANVYFVCLRNVATSVDDDIYDVNTMVYLSNTFLRSCRVCRSGSWSHS